jgi:GNAT superfamily N-acetyltransferase
VWVAVGDGAVQAVAVWMDSAVPIPAETAALVDPLTAELEGDRHSASQAADDAARALRPASRHLLLATVGTAPAMQGRGLGRAVLAPGLAHADAEGVPAYVETSAEPNVSFYAWLGFRVIAHVSIGGDIGGDNGGPDLWAMLREPQSCPNGRPGGPETVTPRGG